VTRVSHYGADPGVLWLLPEEPGQADPEARADVRIRMATVHVPRPDGSFTRACTSDWALSAALVKAVLT